MTTVEKKSVGMSVAEAAAEAGVSESTIYQLFHTGQLPFARRLGHRIVIHRERFSDWLAGESVHQGLKRVTVTSTRRFTEANPCPVCGSNKDLPQGKGVRCWGFLSADGLWAHCTRTDFAGGLTMKPGADTYAHRLQEDCKCGKAHSDIPAPKSVPRATNARLRRPTTTSTNRVISYSKR
jgi:excisionase family DNA binding protein